MRLIMCLLAAFLTLALPARAESLSPQDEADFRAVIADQIAAFQADDGARAYSHAAPMIRQIFPDPGRFMAMVKQGYQPVYRPQSYSFGTAGFSASGRPIQRVMIVGPDGLNYEAIYTMERQPDGTWQINGCALVKAKDVSA
ncbi:MAG: DUF4864 domain-containing protein [Aestuariivirga sp.]|uniref:DUF4864 domain-containing protein n=1 Tax=Aestuariivirga sp. TaxID=2650926 RepID=UPI0025C49FF4|nr:DUF4864 domain-containing protein [Aestuariivirga sp.]MCA3560604.1 DUF4864 domain-containing protein [Aestuariivirga sp.]